MTKLYLYAWIGGLLLMLSAAQPSSIDKRKLLLRRWLLHDFQTPRLERNFTQRGISAERRAQVMHKLVQDSYLHFHEDGTYEASLLGSNPELMYWELKDEENLLHVRKLRTASPNTIEIEILTNRQFIIALPDVDGEFSRLVFIPAEP